MVGRLRAGGLASSRPRRLPPGRGPGVRPLQLAGRRGGPERHGAPVDRGPHLGGGGGSGPRTVRNPVLGGLHRPRRRARGSGARRGLVRHPQDRLHRGAPRGRRRVPPGLSSGRLPALLGVGRAAAPAPPRAARGDPAPARASRPPGLLRGRDRPIARRGREAARGEARPRRPRRGGGPDPGGARHPPRRRDRPRGPRPHRRAEPRAGARALRRSGAPRRGATGRRRRRISPSRTRVPSRPPTPSGSPPSATTRRRPCRPAPPT